MKKSIAIAAMILFPSFSALAANSNFEWDYRCNPGEDFSELKISMAIKDFSKLFRGDVVVRNGRPVSLSGVITNSQVESPRPKEDSPRPNASSGTRPGDLQANMANEGTLAAQELRPGEKVPPPTGLFVGKNGSGFFSAAFSDNGNLKTLWCQGQTDEGPVNVVADKKSKEQADLCFNLMTQLKPRINQLIRCCTDSSAPECGHEGTPATAQLLESQIQVPTQNSFGTQSPFSR